MRKWSFLLFLFACCLALAVASCKTKPPPASSQETTTITIRDTTVTQPSLVMRDTVLLQVDCDEKGVGTIRPVLSATSHALGSGSLTLAGSGTKLLLESRYAPPPITVQGNTTRHSSEKVVKPACDPVMFVPGIYKFQFWVAAIVEVLLIGYIAYRISKPG